MWIAFACQISLSLRLYFYGLRVARNLSSVPIQKYETMTYNALYRRLSLLISDMR